MQPDRDIETLLRRLSQIQILEISCFLKFQEVLESGAVKKDYTICNGLIRFCKRQCSSP